MMTEYNKDKIEEKQEEWADIENYVTLYKKQFEPGATAKDIRLSQDAAHELIIRFNPLFKKYIMLFKTGQIDFKDSDVKTFVSTFIDDPRLHRALKRQKSRTEYRSDIYKKFGFVLETYGQLTEEEILTDMQMLLLVLAKRYKQVGKNFCAYVHNCFRYEVSRHIKKYIKNPLNITYKNVPYENSEFGCKDGEMDAIHEDVYYEPENGVPNATWINGETCSELFGMLTPLERKIVVKYYAEEYNDKQIADALGLHINTVNQKRRQAVAILASSLNIDLDSVKRNRHSGRKAN